MVTSPPSRRNGVNTKRGPIPFYCNNYISQHTNPVHITLHQQGHIDFAIHDSRHAVSVVTQLSCLRLYTVLIVCVGS